MIATLTSILVAYLAGAIPFGLIIAWLFGVEDLRSVGSGNTGATNVQRAAGFKAAIWVYLLDIGKGIVVILIARQVNQKVLAEELFLVLVASSAVLGHIFPIYLRFKGGKGINTAFGCLLLLIPIETLIAFIVFLLVALPTKYISLGSICATFALPVTIIIEKYLLSYEVSVTYLFLTILLAAVVLYTHRENIKRLLAGEESSFKSGSKQNGAGLHV